MKKSERLQALDILLKLLDKKISLNHSMQGNSLSPLSKEIAFGVCRHYYQLQSIANLLVQKRPKSLEVWLILLIGLYQLHSLRIPDYAAVQETVALLDAIKKSWAKSLINAVLRNYCRKKEELLTALKDAPSYAYNNPPWLIARIEKDWPKDWQSILKACDEHPPLSLRINRQRETTINYLSRLQKANIDAHIHSFAKDGLQLTNPCDVTKLPGFTEGDVSVQDQAAQLATSLLDLKPGIRVLDACCAPGGKTCHILETEPNLACLAIDIDGKRLMRVRENLQRLHLKATILEADLTQPNSWWDGRTFDRILLDAPCSATGVIRRHPDIKLLRTAKDITTITKIQQTLLQTVWPLLSEGGRLLYATCSLLAVENELQIAKFISTHSDCHFLNMDYPWGRNTGHGWQILPGENNMDGFFYSVLVKST